MSWGSRLFSYFERFLTESGEGFLPVLPHQADGGVGSFIPSGIGSIFTPLHFLVTEGGTDKAGVFHQIPRMDNSRLAEILAREVPSFLVARELLSPEGAERLLSWPDTNVSPTEAGYRIRIKPNGGTYTYYTVGQNIQSYRLAGLLTKKNYFWNVLALGNNEGIADSPGPIPEMTTFSRPTSKRRSTLQS